MDINSDKRLNQNAYWNAFAENAVMDTPPEAPNKCIIFSPEWKICAEIRAAISHVILLQNIPFNFIIFSTDMKTSVAIRTAIRKAVSFISEYQGGDNFLHVLFDETFIEDETYSLKLARAISYLTARPIYVCRGGYITEIKRDKISPVTELPYQCDNLFQSKHIQCSHGRNIPSSQTRLRHYLDDCEEMALLLSIERYLDITEAKAQAREFTKEVFDRMRMAAREGTSHLPNQIDTNKV